MDHARGSGKTRRGHQAVDRAAEEASLTSTKPRRASPNSTSRPTTPISGATPAAPSARCKSAPREMHERLALYAQLNAITRIERELDDQITMIELGDSEKDTQVVTEAENA